MKPLFKSLGLSAAMASMLAISPAFADTDKHTSTKDSHRSVHQPMHGSGSSSMMGNHQAMHAMMHGAKGSRGADCHGAGRADRDLSVDDVRNILEGQLVWRGNKRLKVGKVVKGGDETYIAEIVTIDDSLVERLEVNRNTGAMRPVR